MTLSVRALAASIQDTPTLRATLALVAYALVLPSLALVASAPAGHRFGPYIASHLALTLCTLVAWAALRTMHPDKARRLVHTAIALGVVARVALIPMPALTSSDVSRYLWDGSVVLHGLDPYAHTPDSLAHAHLDVPLPLDHTDVPTCYPPLALALFAACAATGSFAFLTWKVLVALASIATLLLVHWHLRDADRRANIVLLALGPLALLEAGMGGHLDALVALTVTFSVIASERAYHRLAALSLGVAIALKLFPVIFAFALFAQAPRRIEAIVGCALPLAVSALLTWLLGVTPLGSLPLVAETWSFGSPLWSFATWALTRNEAMLRVRVAMLGLLAITWLSLHRSRVRAAQESLGAWLFVTPTLYPWYATTLAPLTALRPTPWAIALLAILPTSYEVIDAYQAEGVWAPASWPLFLVALVWAGAGLSAAWRHRLRLNEQEPPRPAE